MATETKTKKATSVRSTKAPGEAKSRSRGKAKETKAVERAAEVYNEATEDMKQAEQAASKLGDVLSEEPNSCVGTPVWRHPRGLSNYKASKRDKLSVAMNEIRRLGEKTAQTLRAMR